MLKKVLSLILLIIMVFSVSCLGITVLAEEYETCELLWNGDMEWGHASYGFWSKYESVTDIVHSGTKAAVLRTYADDANTTDALESRVIITNRISDLIPGQTYTVSYWLRREVDFESATVMNDFQSLKAGAVLKPAAGMKLEFKKADGSAAGSGNFDSSYPTVAGEWQYFEFTVKAPAGAVSATIHMRSQGIGDMYFDDLSVSGPCTAEVKAQYDQLRLDLQEGYEMSQYLYNESLNKANDIQLSGDNLAGNPGFEDQEWSWKELKNTLAVWKGINVDGVVNRVTTDKKSGNASLLLDVPTTYTSGTHPYAYQRITPPDGDTTFIAGASYFISSWMKTVGAPLNAGSYYNVKFSLGTGQESPIISTNGEWKQNKYIFTMPENVEYLDLYLRCSPVPGMDAYFDDVEFGLASVSNPILLNTEHTFYYSDEGDITASANFNTGVAAFASGSKIRYTLSDENGTAVATNEVATAETTEWTFDPSTLMAKKTKYVLKAEYIDPSGNASSEWVKTKNIYLYDRPQMLDTNGNVLDGDFVNGEFVPNGKIVPPFFTYRHTVTGRTDEFAAAGITVLRPSEEITIEYLDELHANGMKALVQLYGSYTAGHARAKRATINKVNLTKNHPAVLAYMIMDEPTKQVSPTCIVTYEEMLYYLEEAYQIIREIDDVHPVFVLESYGDVADGYERTSQMCDIFAIDPYPNGVAGAIGGSIAAKTQHARNAVYDERPVWMLGLAASGWSGDYGNPANYGSAMLRYQIYDALWAGAKGVGHYLWEKDTMTDGTPYGDIYLDTFATAKASGETDEIFDHFLLGNSEVLNEGAGNGYQWRSWYKDNGDIYLAVRSKLSDDGKTVLDTVTADFKLASANGKFSIDGFDATLVNGTSEQTVSSATNNFKCTITKGEVSLYKVNPIETFKIETVNQSSIDIIPLEYGEELIENGDAESGDTPGYHTAQGYTNFARTDANKANGTYSFMITPKNNGSPQYRATNVPIDGNAYYEFSFNMYSDYFTEAAAPTIWLYYQDANKADIKCIKLYIRNAGLHSGEWKKYTYILPSYVPKSTEPEAEYMSMQIKIPGEISSIYFDDISLRTVTSYNEENLLTNASFEQFDVGGTLRNWTAGNTSLSDNAHKDICSIGINNTSLYTSALVDGGKTYLFYTWFNASDLTSADSYPTLRVQVGDFVSTADFTNAFDRKDSGWHKLATEVTIPDSVAENSVATVALVMNGTDTGYFDDVTFKIKGKTGYTLRNLKTSASDSSINVEYDINSHFTEDGGTVFYVFYDADGRYLKMEKEAAAFGGAHITRSFDKVDFAGMKIFVWDSLGGMLPYSNVIQ